MDVVSVCPLRVAQITWRPERNRHALTVVCRGTFYLREGRVEPADVQLPAVRKDQYLRANGASSLLVPTDLVPAKRGVDVVLVGRARAPGGIAVASFGTRLAVGSIDKRIEIFAERFFTPAGELVQAARTAKVPLAWERAAGGPGTDNPVGVGNAQRDRLGRVALAQLQPPGLRVTDPDEPIEPTGYGPIAPTWPIRQACLSQPSGDWSAEQWWARPLPDGFDFGYFNVAPADQRIDSLQGDEPLLLENLLESSSTLRTRLPRWAPIGTITRRRGEAEPLELRADTLWIDTDRGICTITWRGRVSLWQPSEQGRVEIDWAEGPPAPFRAGGKDESIGGSRGVDPRWLAMPTDDPDGGVTEPSYIPDDDEPVLATFAALDSALGRPPIGEPLWLREENEADTAAFERDRTEPGRAATLPPLPFQSSAAIGPNGTMTPHPSAPGSAGPNGHLRVSSSPRESTEVTRLPQPGAEAPPLPFRNAGGLNGAALAGPAVEAADDPLPFRKSVPPAAPLGRPGRGEERPSGLAPPPLVRAQTGPTVPIPPPRPTSPWVGAEAGARGQAPHARASSLGAPPPVVESNGGEPPAPPPLIGPLATPDMVAREQGEGDGSPVPDSSPPTSSAEALASTAVGTEETDGEAPQPSDRFESGPGLRLLQLGACARAAASIARRPEETEQILAEYAIDAAVWKANEAYWAERIREQTSRGRTQMLRDYDAAYVDGLERERGALTAEQYAVLVVAAERGQGARALGELGLPPGAMVRIERVFLRRVLESGPLGDRIRRAIEAERGR